MQAFQANTADSGWFLDPTKLATFQALPGYTSYVDNGAGFEWLVYNMHDPILKDKVVRHALQESIDPPNEIYKTIYNGTVKPTCDDSAGTFAHEPNLIPCYKFNPADAGNILDADGWVMGADNFRHKNGQTLELQYATTAKQSREETQAIFIQDWKKIGIKVDQKNYSNTQDWFGTGALCQGNFQIGEFANQNTDPDDHAVFSSDQLCETVGGQNYNYYSNATVDQQEKVQLGTIDQTARKAAFHIIHQQILQRHPVHLPVRSGEPVGPQQPPAQLPAVPGWRGGDGERLGLVGQLGKAKRRAARLRQLRLAPHTTNMLAGDEPR